MVSIEAVGMVREEKPEMVFISFPAMKEFRRLFGGGQGFFHINSHGGAEPCPFFTLTLISTSRDIIEKEALHSRLLFTFLHEQGFLTADHQNGCVLFESREQVGNSWPSKFSLSTPAFDSNPHRVHDRIM